MEDYEDNDEIPAASKKLIEKIRRLYHKHYSRRKGVVACTRTTGYRPLSLYANIGHPASLPGAYTIVPDEGSAWAQWDFIAPGGSAVYHVTFNRSVPPFGFYLDYVGVDSAAPQVMDVVEIAFKVAGIATNLPAGADVPAFVDGVMQIQSFADAYQSYKNGNAWGVAMYLIELAKNPVEWAAFEAESIYHLGKTAEVLTSVKTALSAAGAIWNAWNIGCMLYDALKVGCWTDGWTVMLVCDASTSSLLARVTASPTSGGVPLSVSFSGAGSTVPSGPTPSYHWDFGDGTHATGISASHTYTSDGLYTAALTVTTSGGLIDTAYTQIAAGDLTTGPARVSGTLLHDTLWTAARGVYVVDSLAIPAGTRLTVEPGVVVKFNSGGSLSVQGQIVANGTESSPIYFTSIKDDSVGGDTNADGNVTSPAAGNWHYIQISGSGASGTFDHCVAKYGGYEYCGYYCYFYGILDCRDGGALAITNSSISHGAPYGISSWVNPGSGQPKPSLHLADSTISSCGREGILIAASSSLSITGCTVSGNGGTGISINDSTAPSVTGCTVSGNGGNGISSDAPGQVITNCIIASNGSYGACLTGASPKVLYCDLSSNGTNYYGSPDLTGTIYAAPLFVNPAAGDYHLQDTSPCIDTGDPALLDPDGSRSDIGAIPNLGLSVSTAKCRADEEQADSVRGVVTAVFDDAFYVESNNRSNGIRVEPVVEGINLGTQLRVSGVVRTNDDGERCIEATTVNQSASPVPTGPLTPLGLRNNWLGGNAFGLQSAVAPQGFGLNNIGLLVRVWGRVVEIETASPATWFRIDDGSYLGVKCLVPAGVIIDPAWQWVGVTGISSCEKIGNELHRLLRVRQQSDITAF